MKERPILFSGPMVRAILEGRKTQTRRVMNPQIGNTNLKTLVNNDGDMEIRYLDPSKRDGVRWEVFVKGKYGKPGDRLWVRETWGLMSFRDVTDWCSESIVGIPRSELLDQYLLEHAANWQLPHEPAYWRPSIHMPRWASRITLEIESVRVERLQDISPDDCRAEGMPRENNDIGVRYGYGQLWNSINGKGSWELNPWVWVIQFKLAEVK